MEGRGAVERISAAVMVRPAAGYNIHGETMAEVLGESPTLLVFLRHFG